MLVESIFVPVLSFSCHNILWTLQHSKLIKLFASSAPKLYSSQPVKNEIKPAELPPPVVGVSVAPPPTVTQPDPEPKKKKMKPDIAPTQVQTSAYLTHAQEMAEKVWIWTCLV